VAAEKINQQGKNKKYLGVLYTLKFVEKKLYKLLYLVKLRKGSKIGI